LGEFYGSPRDDASNMLPGESEGVLMKNAHQSIGLLLAPVVFVLLWSGGYAVAKVGIKYAEPITLLVWRYFLVVVLLVPFYLALKPPLPKRKIDWLHMAVVGILVQGVYFGMCWFAFSQGIAAGVVAIIMSLQPILVAILAPALARENVSWRRWSGLILGFIGVMVVIAARSRLEPPSVVGIGVCIIALAGITSGVLYEKRFGVSHHPVISNLGQYGAGLIFVFPIAYSIETMQVQWTGTLVAALAYLVIGNSILAITLLLAMIRAGEVSAVSALLFLVPPLAAIFGWFLLGEIMPPIAWIGMALAGIGVIIATRRST
jgi:drug/metabolite transporter (DMT)-like permease